MKKAASPTGNSPVDARGYTLLEILLTVSVIAVASAFIFPSFFKSADMLENIKGRFLADMVLSDLLVQSEIDLRRSGSLELAPRKGKTALGGKTFDFVLNAAKRDTHGRLYEVHAGVEWRDFKKNTVSESAYAFQ